MSLVVRQPSMAALFDADAEMHQAVGALAPGVRGLLCWPTQ
jgi:hypothetical protein